MAKIMSLNSSRGRKPSVPQICVCTRAQVQLMKNGNVVASVWENNREDGEDSATQVQGETSPLILNKSIKSALWFSVAIKKLNEQTRSCFFFSFFFLLRVLLGHHSANEEGRPGVHGADVWEEALQPSAVQHLQRSHRVPQPWWVTAQL